MINDTYGMNGMGIIHCGTKVDAIILIYLRFVSSGLQIGPYPLERFYFPAHVAHQILKQDEIRMRCPMHCVSCCLPSHHSHELRPATPVDAQHPAGAQHGEADGHADAVLDKAHLAAVDLVPGDGHLGNSNAGTGANDSAVVGDDG